MMARNRQGQELPPFEGNQEVYFDQATTGPGLVLRAPEGQVFSVADKTTDYRLLNEQLGPNHAMIGVPTDDWHPEFVFTSIVRPQGDRWEYPDDRGEYRPYLPLYGEAGGDPRKGNFLMLGRSAFKKVGLRLIRPEEDIKQGQERGLEYLQSQGGIDYLPVKYAAAILAMSRR